MSVKTESDSIIELVKNGKSDFYPDFTRKELDKLESAAYFALMNSIEILPKSLYRFERLEGNIKGNIFRVRLSARYMLELEITVGKVENEVVLLSIISLEQGKLR